MQTQASAPTTRPCPTCDGRTTVEVFEKDGYRLVRCAACELLYVANPPTPEQLEHIYSFDSGYHVVFRESPEEVANRFALARTQLATVTRHSAPGRLLDLGATAGFFVKTATDAGWHATGIELSTDTAALARERYGVDVLSARLEDVDFEAGSFDAVTLWDVIEHVDDPRDTMDRVATLLRPHGIVGISTPNIDGLYPRLSYKLAGRTGRWNAVEPPWHLTQFSLKTLTDLLDRTGFEVAEVRQDRQPLAYSVGRVRGIRSLKEAAFVAAFLPLAAVGPLFGAGDEISVIARRRA